MTSHFAESWSSPSLLERARQLRTDAEAYAEQGLWRPSSSPLCGGVTPVRAPAGLRAQSLSWMSQVPIRHDPFTADFCVLRRLHTRPGRMSEPTKGIDSQGNRV